MRRCIILLCSFIILSSCSLFVGRDGSDGIVNLAIDWVEQPVFYTDTNPAIPQNFIRRQFYESKPGRYSFQYAYDDEFGWEGFYELQPAEPGQNGKFFRKSGRDGQSVFYTLILSYRGTTLGNLYEKSLTGEYEVFIDEIIDGFRIVVYMKLVKIETNYPAGSNKLQGDK